MMLNTLLLQSVEMADAFRADGKIWVVVAVLGVTLIGLFSYLFYTERRISRLEKELNSNK
ncbi:MAG: CcmD family protein [Spirosomataceae bacterium]